MLDFENYILCGGYMADGKQERTLKSSVDFFDITVLEVYRQKCPPLHVFSGIRNHHILHYILSGKGKLSINGKEYELSAGDGFYCAPYEKIVYYADAQDPWEYYLVSFDGYQANAIMNSISFATTKVFSWREDRFFEEQMQMIYEYTFLDPAVSYYHVLGQMYHFFAGMIARFPVEKRELQKESDNEMAILDKMVSYVASHYSGVCNVADICETVKLDRSYLYRICKKYFNISPNSFIERYRMRCACELLRSGHMRIGDVAAAVGYEDQHYFSRVFKKLLKISPMEFVQINEKYPDSGRIVRIEWPSEWENLHIKSD